MMFIKNVLVIFNKLLHKPLGQSTVYLKTFFENVQQELLIV
jgi:hypothetical protein